jgi:hypothetical protein
MKNTNEPCTPTATPFTHMAAEKRRFLVVSNRPFVPVLDAAWIDLGTAFASLDAEKG